MLQRLGRTLRTSLALFGIAILAGALAGQLVAQEYGGQNYQDPPGRVARIRYVQGSVSFEPAGTQDWVPAVTNRPVTIGDQLWVDASSRAELDMGSAVVRIGQNTGMSFLNLDDNTTQIQLTQGELNLRVRRLRPNTVLEVDTPNQAFSVYQPGVYKVEASQDGGSTMVTVRQGQGQATGAGQAYTLDAGQSGSFTGDGTNSLYGQVTELPSPDDLDQWAQSRDAAYDRSVSARYVSPDMVGYEDLDNNGSWASDPSYGNVWYPNTVSAGWAPYREGHWAWISPWGWTWVDDEPWGYAPFHYGRWAYVHNRWGWVPGPMQAEPVYAPALVAFIGGSGFGVSVSVGGGGGYGPGGGDVGWFPLGPREVYVPSYNATPQYVERVNTTNTVVSTTTVTNVYNNVVNNNQVTNVTYVNRTNPAAVTVVPQTVLRNAEPVQRAVVQVDPKRIESAPIAPRAAVVPTQASVAGTANPAATHMARPPAAVMERKVVAKTAPPPPPVPFAKQEPILAKQAGKPLPPQQVQQLRPQAQAAAAEHPQVKIAPPAKPATLARGPANPPANQPGRPAPNAPPQSQAAQQQQAQQQAAEKAREQQAQQQAAQQQAAQQRQQQAQQSAQQQAAEKAREQQAQQQAARQATQQRQQQAQQSAQQQAAEKAREQQAQQQAAQQQAAQQRQQQAQQSAQQQAAEKAREQQAQQQSAQQQAAQQRQQQAQQSAQQQAAEKAREQQAAEKAREQQAQQQSAQQQAAQQRQQQAQQSAQQQAAEKAREQQAQQQAAQQQAAQQRQQQAQQSAQQQAAERAREQQAQQQAAQQAAQQRQQQAQPPSAQQQAAERAREQQAQQQAAQQQRQQQAQPPSAQQQAAERAREQQAQQQAAQQRQQQAQQAQTRPPANQPNRPPAAQPPAQQRPQQGQPPQQAKPNRPQTPEEKAREEQQKREQSQPPQ